MSFKSYTEFLLETHDWAESQKAKREYFQAIAKNILEHSEYVAFKYMLNESVEFVDALYESSFNEGNSLNEATLVQQFKEKYDKIKDNIKQGGQEAMKKLSAGAQAVLKFGGNLLQPVKAIIAKVGEMIKQLWEKTKKLAEQAVEASKPELIKRFKNAISTEDKKLSLRNELKNIKTMTAAASKWATTGFSADLAKASQKAASENVDENYTYLNTLEVAILKEATQLIESNDLETLYKLQYECEIFAENTDINEALSVMEGDDHGGGDKRKLSIPLLSKLMSKVGHTPPFSWFHELGAKAEKVTNNGLEKVSYYLTKVANAPGPFEFAIMGGLVGVAVSYFTEKYAKGWTHDLTHWIEHALHITIPGLGILFNIIKYTGIALAVYGLVEQLFGESDKGDKKEDSETSKA